MQQCTSYATSQQCSSAHPTPRYCHTQHLRGPQYKGGTQLNCKTQTVQTVTAINVINK